MFWAAASMHTYSILPPYIQLDAACMPAGGACIHEWVDQEEEGVEQAGGDSTPSPRQQAHARKKSVDRAATRKR
jgi:hypothetical protein